LSLRSEVGKGTVFRVVLPLAEPAPSSARAEPIGELRPRGVLLVEDDALVREATLAVFEARGFWVEAVSSADRVLDTLARLEAEGRRPDLVVTDHRLPGALTGEDLVRKLHAAPDPLPVVLMSGDVEAPFLRQAPPPGVTVLRKPVSAEALLEAALERVAVRERASAAQEARGLYAGTRRARAGT
ncbi:MAG: response regulator, partial [Polyangiaceae bacterium]|nr:response regulator [Polyangiaceae bacterium]